MDLKPWEIWGHKPFCEKTLIERAKGTLPEMECTKQLVSLVQDIYSPGMTVLDAGCNAGHYLLGLRRIDSKMSYVGVDAYEEYILTAKMIFKNDPYARFEVKSILKPLFPNNKFDITFCCNVLLHLPNFKLPIKNLLDSTNQVLIVRSLFGDYSTIVHRATEKNMDFDENGIPMRFVYQNQYDRISFEKYINKLGWDVVFIKDQFDPKVLDREHKELKQYGGTKILEGKQVDGNILFNWEWAKITRKY